MSIRPIVINDDWRWHREGHSVVLERRGEVKIKKARDGMAVGDIRVVWEPCYFSSLERALGYLLEADASAAQSLREFTARLNKAKADVNAMLREKR